MLITVQWCKTRSGMAEVMVISVKTSFHWEKVLLEVKTSPALLRHSSFHSVPQATKGNLFWSKSYKNPSKPDDFEGFDMEQGTGIEPASSAWEADVLPMY